MMIQKGYRGKLSECLDPARPLQILLSTVGTADYDTCCFGVDAEDQLKDDRYMVFYNQPASPGNEITFSAEQASACYAVSLPALPAAVAKLVFTVSIDGQGTMHDITSHTLQIRQEQQTVLEFALTGADFHQEKAIISIELYRKADEWRIFAAARGFDGGLGDLLRHFGGEIAEEPVAAPETTPATPSIPAPEPVAPPSPAPEPVAPPSPAEPQKAEKLSLKKGERVSLTKADNDTPILIECGWTAKGKDYDLKALVLYRNGTQIYVGAANVDEKLSTPEGAVQHGGDIKRPGELERISIRWHPDIQAIAVSAYSAVENGLGSFRRYGVFVRITNGKQIIEIPARSISANGMRYTLCFGEILFDTAPGKMEVSALEMYSGMGSEKRIGYQDGKVKMDIGPVGRCK